MVSNRIQHQIAKVTCSKLRSISPTDGIREKERSLISTCLKSISVLRENTYYLSRHIWNDVQEDWPFYTEQDRQTLKR